MHAIAIDFETSGYRPHDACAVGMVRVRDGQICDSFYSLIRPKSRKVFFTEVHGLTWDMLKNQPSFSEIWPQMAAFIQDATHFIAHNASFDKRVLHGSCKYIEASPPSLPFACTLQLSRKHLKLPSHRLSAVCQHFGISFTHHHALEDALAAAQIFLLLQQNTA